MGHTSRDAGAEFEQRIENALVAATQAGIVAWWTHQQPAFTLSRRPLKPSGADFALVLRGGCAGAIEAKTVKGERLQRDAVAPEQSRHLDAVLRAGGLALLAVEFRDDATGRRLAYLAPWGSVPWERLRTAYSVGATALHPFVIPPERSIESLVRECLSCKAYWPRRPDRHSCCSGGPPL